VFTISFVYCSVDNIFCLLFNFNALTRKLRTCKPFIKGLQIAHRISLLIVWRRIEDGAVHEYDWGWWPKITPKLYHIFNSLQHLFKSSKCAKCWDTSNFKLWSVSISKIGPRFWELPAEEMIFALSLALVFALLLNIFQQNLERVFTRSMSKAIPGTTKWCGSHKAFAALQCKYSNRSDKLLASSFSSHFCFRIKWSTKQCLVMQFVLK